LQFLLLLEIIKNKKYKLEKIMKKFIYLITSLLIIHLNFNLLASSQPATAAGQRAQTVQAKPAKVVMTGNEMLGMLINLWLQIINPPVATHKGTARLLGLIEETPEREVFKIWIETLGHLAPSFLNKYPFLVQAAPDQNMVEFLVKHGALVNQQDNNGNTALHKIAQDQYNFALHSDLIDFLLKHGANHAIKNKAGWSFNDKLKLHEANNKKRMAEYLKTISK
jgi:hypothetical protein